MKWTNHQVLKHFVILAMVWRLLYPRGSMLHVTNHSLQVKLTPERINWIITIYIEE
jgi:hypothetical protein